MSTATLLNHLETSVKKSRKSTHRRPYESFHGDHPFVEDVFAHFFPHYNETLMEKKNTTLIQNYTFRTHMVGGF